MDTIVGVQMYGLILLMAGTTRDDFANGHSALANFPNPSADLEVVRSLYEVFDLHGAGDFDAGVQRLISAEAAGASGGFEFLTYLVPSLTRSDEPRVDDWLPPIKRISGTLPNFAMSLLSCVDLCMRNRREKQVENALLRFIKSHLVAGEGLLKRCPDMLEPVLSMQREFGKPCMLGVHLRLPKAHGDWVGNTLLSHKAINAVPWDKNTLGFGNADGHDVGWINLEQGRISAISTASTVTDVSDLPTQIDRCFSAVGDQKSEMKFGEWEVGSSGRMVHGYAIDDDLGRAMYFIVYNESNNNQGYSRVTREVILFAPELDGELAKHAAKVLRDGRSGVDVSLAESGRDLTAERTEKRRAWLDALRAACSAAGNIKAVEIVDGVDAADENSVEKLGADLYYAFAGERNSMEADPEGWFEEDDEGHREFVEDFVKLAGGELKLSSLESDVDDNAVETVRCEINGERFEAKAHNVFHTIDMNFVSALVQHCRPLGTGCYINLMTSDGLALAYVPREIGEILIDHSPVIGG